MPEWIDLNSPALTLAIAMAAGMFAIVAGTVLRVPGILLALGLGVALGPDVLNIVRPAALAPAPGDPSATNWLQVVVGFCVSVILFEGALSLNPSRLKRAGKPVRRLITIGALIAAAGAGTAAFLVMKWPAEIAALFGALLIVTGPTVIAPLLRRIKAEKTVAAVLSAEGVLGDAVGAMLATALFSVAISPQIRSFGTAAEQLGGIVLTGGVVGGGIGLVIAALGRWRGLAQAGVNRVAMLALVMLAFQLSNAFMHESGIMAVVVAGLVVGFLGTQKQEELMEFKEELSILFIGLLFVVLAANVRLAELRDLVWEAAIVAACVVFLVRPASVLLSTINSGLTLRQRLFIAWIGPRGIVAAAVASLFANEMVARGMNVEIAAQFRAVVFATIVLTVTIAGLTGKLVGRMLGVLAKTNQGWLIFGANRVAMAMAQTLKDAGDEVVLIDRNREAVAEAEAAGLTVIQGNGLESATLLRAGVETRKGIIAMTGNDEVNLLFVQTSRRLQKNLQAWLVLGGAKGGVTDKMIEDEHARVLAGRKIDIALLAAMIEQGKLELRPRPRKEADREDGKTKMLRAGETPLLVRKGKNLEPASGTMDGVTDVYLLQVTAAQRENESGRRAAVQAT